METPEPKSPRLEPLDVLLKFGVKAFKTQRWQADVDILWLIFLPQIKRRRTLRATATKRPFNLNGGAVLKGHKIIGVWPCRAKDPL